jgi:3-oxoacyl-[acyl-carrier-protein] synthase-3
MPSRAAAFDLAAACSGFIYAISVAAPLVSIGPYRNVLVIGGDVLSRITDYTDRASRRPRILLLPVHITCG